MAQHYVRRDAYSGVVGPLALVGSGEYTPAMLEGLRWVTREIVRTSRRLVVPSARTRRALVERLGAREDARGHVRVDGDTITAHVPASAWFDELRLGPADAMDHAAAELEAEGASALSPLDVTRRRVERGWPLLGAEIDDRTLVQEVRFDEHGGVSYEKGCYVGQETVARLHFRGHTNRNLRGLVFEGDAEPAGERVELDGKDVGRIGTTVNATGRRIGLALVRREVADGARVVAGGIPATVVPLPFGEAADR